MLSVVGDGGAAFAAGARGPRESKVDKVYSVLKQAIVSGALAPDTLIDKGDWSARFEVSKLSVTTAVNRLAFERLAVIEPQRGSYVARIRMADVKQWMLVRRALESEVVAACARDLSDAVIEQLGRNLAYQRAALDSGDLQGFHGRCHVVEQGTRRACGP
jgi:GntR family transcriptional regulator, rspAB operon transcriptional repressor